MYSLDTHHCYYNQYGCGHKILKCGHSASNRRYPEYRGGKTATGQIAFEQMYVDHDCPNCAERAQRKLVLSLPMGAVG